MAKTMAPGIVKVPLKSRSYPIHVGGGILRKLPSLLSAKKSKRAFIISDQDLTEARQRLTLILKNGGWEVHEFAVKAGESFKEFKNIYALYGELLKANANRDSTVFALGGGSIGDGAGFLASTFLRGIDWIGIPTTLLAQVDSSVGGKTAINHELGKNLIGSFHQPKMVLCDTDLLKTLSKREIISGLAEALKYGLIYDPKFFEDLMANFDQALALEPTLLKKIVATSLKWKAQVVAKDEFDKEGIREALNFGHTFGHALESATGYQHFQHGEAVLWGMRFAILLSGIRKKLPLKKALELDERLSSIEVSPLPQTLHFQSLMDTMNQDKKVRNGKIHFVLLKKLGQTVSDPGVGTDHIRQTLELLFKN